MIDNRISFSTSLSHYKRSLIYVPAAIKIITASIIYNYIEKSRLLKGKGFLDDIRKNLLHGVTVTAISNYKGIFILRFPEDLWMESVFFRGTYETGSTYLLKRLINDDDVIFDIGANVGWYTILAAINAPNVQCHSFEPVPQIFKKMQKNCIANKLDNNVFLNQLALGEREMEIELYSFKGLPHSHTSLSTLGREDYDVVKAHMTTLDKYVRDKRISRLDFIKMDVEGAEMSVLRGATSIFKMARPPLWFIEMNEETAQKFGNHSIDVLNFISDHGSFEFYRVIKAWGAIVHMKSINDYEHGDNVLCIPQERYEQVQSLIDAI